MANAEIDVPSAALLGALQGLTEFLPVSSSGHIAIGTFLFGLDDAPLSLSIVLHAGTLLATLALFAGDIARLLADTWRGRRDPKAFAASESGRMVLGVIVATIPTVVIALTLRDRVEAWSHVPWIVGVCLLVSAALVFTTRRQGQSLTAPTWKHALIIGIAQGLAVLPGVSRSGSTIAAAMLLGVEGPAAFRFSFLLSLPAVTGAVILELGHEGVLAGVPMAVWLGGAVAAVIGVVSLVVLRKLVTQGRFWAFTLYLVPVGIGLIAWDFSR